MQNAGKNSPSTQRVYPIGLVCSIGETNGLNERQLPFIQKLFHAVSRSADDSAEVVGVTLSLAHYAMSINIHEAM